MIKLKQITFYPNFSGAEATWVDEVETAGQIPNPDFIAPLIDDPDNEGQQIPDPSVQASLIDQVTTKEQVIRCHSYADCQMSMLRADALELGTSLEEYEEQIAAIEAAYIPPEPEPIPVPQVLTIRQAKLVLLANGLLDDVDAAVNQADRVTQIEWEYATEIKRDWPTLLVMQSALGLTDVQVDNLFMQGAAL